MSDEIKAMDDKELRIVVVVGDAHPELKAAMAALPVRARAERIRHLAGLGLAGVWGRGGEYPPATTIPDVPATFPKQAGPTASGIAPRPKKLRQPTQVAVESKISAPVVSKAENEPAIVQDSKPVTTAHPSLALMARSLGR